MIRDSPIPLKGVLELEQLEEFQVVKDLFHPQWLKNIRWCREVQKQKDLTKVGPKWRRQLEGGTETMVVF